MHEFRDGRGRASPGWPQQRVCPTGRGSRAVLQGATAGGRCTWVRKGIPLVLRRVVLSACAAPTSAAPGGPGAPTVARSYRATVLADAPAAYWRMGETSGTTMTDASKNANTGTYAGAFSVGQPGALAGDKGTAVAFDGLTAGATVASSKSL